MCRASHFLLRALLAGMLAAFPIASALAQDHRIDVDLELVIAVDVSESMDWGEYALQRSGYAGAIAHPAFLRAVRSGLHRQIALTYVEWSSGRVQKVIVPWRLIDDAASAAAFAQALGTPPTTAGRGTSISAALAFGAGLFAENAFDGQRRAIDISGDGPNNSGPPVEETRDRLVEAGIIINGLPILIRPSPTFPAIDRYYADCVIGGPGAFVLPVRSAEEFATAIRRKLIQEIAAQPGARVTPVQGGQPVDCLVGEKMRDLYAPRYPGLND
jgi:hypothetical protein